MKEETFTLTFKGLVANALIKSDLMSPEQVFGTDDRLNRFMSNLETYFKMRDTDSEKLIAFLDDEMRMEMVPMIKD